MAIVLLSINGVGLGHLSRMAELADCLEAAGEKPVLIYQSKSFPFKNKTFHKVGIESLLNASPEYLSVAQDAINTLCRISDPAIFIEDTHPANIKLKPNISSFLVIRPTTFSYLKILRKEHQDRYSAFFIADHPDSPTWPYNEEETAIINSWDNFVYTGPIYRTSKPNGIAALKNKYDWKEHIPLFVFSMGGGGQQSKARDIDIFLEKIRELSRDILKKHPTARLLFVKGPLYPADASLPEGFEIIDFEEDMPALFALATLAVIRPSFNSIWECINAHTPFYYIEGTTFSEPVQQKMQKLSAMNLVSNDHALDEQYQKEFRKKSKQVSTTWPGRPIETLKALMKYKKPGQLDNHDADLFEGSGWKSAWGKFNRSASSLQIRRFFIRVDDVVEMTEELNFILKLATQFKIFMSLEIIPSLSKLKEETIVNYRAGNDNLIVAQHGFGHMLNPRNSKGVRSEFEFSDPPSEREVQNLLAGKKYMENQFPLLFRGGFSAPFDTMPSWLPEILKQEGWAYFLINQNKDEHPLPAIRARVDIWNWKEQRMKPIRVVVDKIIQQNEEDGYFGLILHPLHFKSQVNKKWLNLLLELLDKASYGSFNFIALIKRQIDE